MLPNPWTRPFVSVPVAADCLGISRRSAYRAAQSGELFTTVRRGRLQVPAAALWTWAGLPCPDEPGPDYTPAPAVAPAPPIRPTVLAG